MSTNDSDPRGCPQLPYSGGVRFACISNFWRDRIVGMFSRRVFHVMRIQVAVTVLVAFLQRSPLLRIASAGSVFSEAPSGVVLRALALVAGSLGAIQTLAGATVLVASTPSPVSTTVGANVSIAFTVSNTINIGSWEIGGTLPPGLTLSAKEGGDSLTGPGVLDATTPGAPDGYGGTAGGNITTTPVLTGRPTTPGTYTFSLRAFEMGAKGGLASGTFNYSITVTGAATGSAPTVSDPQSQTVAAGGSATFAVTVSGSPAPTLQWQKNGADIAGATGTSLTLSRVQVSDGGTYTAVVTNSGGTVTSRPATLTVSSALSGPPTFTSQPASQTVLSGGTVAFNAVATNASGYQWMRNGGPIAGATDSVLVVSGATAASAGAYNVVASNGADTATSNTATLTVAAAGSSAPPRLSNLSVRTNTGTGDQVLNVGFAVGGAGTAGTKPLLIRVAGPTLASFGVTGTAADPVLTVQALGSSNAVAANDNWSGAADVAATSVAVGAFPFTSAGSADAAVVTSLNGGTYTALAAGKNNTTGVVLTEIYDATPSGGFSASTPRLVNVSARAQVGTGDAVLIAGFAITGSTSKTLLIRATGPALAGFGVAGALPDPVLQISPLGGAKLYENDNWGGANVIASVTASVGAFPISDRSSKDAVLVVTLPPGAYTAQVSGVNNGTGIALVEVYEIP